MQTITLTTLERLLKKPEDDPNRPLPSGHVTEPLGMSHRMVLHYIRTGALRAYKIPLPWDGNPVYFVTKRAVDEFLADPPKGRWGTATK